MNESANQSTYSAAKRRWARWRDGLRERPVADFVYRVVIGVVGLLVLAVGIIAIPYPGPGWAIVFLGLAILATEFRAAQVALHWVRQRYDAVMAWFGRQHIAVKALSAAFTGLVVVASLWGLGALYWFGDLIGFQPAWLKSPIGIGSD
ncbi:TIGR02611 family protein [Mycolicibacterium sp. J2]|uniref:TIGR02611 family protein n=1 Tax=Mycolicibacterium sp. J2 TaxID=2993511 RepID=UPI00224ACFCD|nr:TIGR02611 family protein [Mycolicibacterium sp. J2]MCX2711736.1 TIGR02611 family protein [Mycolicibacterium sp. J2]